MNDLSVIDRFLDVFSRYIDSGFGLLGGEVAFLTATLVVIDMTLAGLFWAMGGNDDVIARLIKKVLYVGAFAFIITNFNTLAGILFNSFAGLGLTATGNTLTQAELLQPGRLAAVGVDAGRPILAHIDELSGFPDFLMNLSTIAVLFLAWLVVIVSFFILAVQLFVTLIEFKLTTLAGFVLVPFALWNKTAFLAERVLGNVISAGIKVLVLAVIVGIGAGIFGEFRTPPGAEPSLDQALAIMLAALSLLGLGIFGPGIATGLVSGGPQLGAGAAVGTALAAGGGLVAGGAAVAAGARLGAGAVRAVTAGAATSVRAAGATVTGAGAAYSAGAATSAQSGGTRAIGAGVANVIRSGAQAVRRAISGGGSTVGLAGSSSPDAADTAADRTPAWAQRLQRRQRLSTGVSIAAHAVRSSDHGGSGASPSLKPDGD